MIESNFQILISSYGNRIYDIDLTPANNGISMLIVHQITPFVVYDYSRFNLLNVKLIISRTKGISASRNVALENASADIVMLADDDLLFDCDGIQSVVNFFHEYDYVDVVVAKLKTKNHSSFRDYSRYLNKSKIKGSFEACSCELFFRAKSIRGLYFDSHFGVGSKYPGFEENLFLHQLYKRGQQFFFVDHFVAIHNGDTHTGLRRDKDYMIAYGAYMRIVFPRTFLFRIGRFFISDWLKKRRCFVDCFVSTWFITLGFLGNKP